MVIVDGKAVAKQFLRELELKTAGLSRKPSLRVILVGDDPGSRAYVRAKEQAARQVGIDFALHHFPGESNEQFLAEFIQTLNRDRSITGFLLQLPLAGHLDTNNLLNLIDPKKDVDCLTAANLGRLAQDRPRFLPAAAAAVEIILKKQGFTLQGSHVVVIGRSRIAGLPVALQLLHQNATVTIIHSQTPNLCELTRQADLIISAAGKPGLIKAAMLKKGAGIIDIGWAKVGGKPAGDVDPTNLESVASFYTPVPGGVGPITVACLLHNVLSAYQDASSR